MKNSLKIIISLISVAILVAIDQITKYYVNINMTPYKDEVEVIKGVFALKYIKNSGAAWGSFSGKTILLLIISIILILALYKNILFTDKYLALKICILFIVGGAIGNMIDRIRLGYVIDFIETKFIDFPVFNFADICVTVSMFVVLILFLFKYKNEDMDVMFALKSYAINENEDTDSDELQNELETNNDETEIDTEYPEKDTYETN